MAIAKRIFFFVLVNILVMITITTVLSVLGVQPYLTNAGINFQALAVFCLVWGFGGAFVSLSLSRIMAKFSMGVKVIDPRTNESDLRWLLDTTYELSRSAGLGKMPEVGYYQSPDVNAFATGPTKNRALVAVSTGLLQSMNREQAKGVLGHEIAHVANGDMVTMTLIQGVVNAFVMFFARIAAFALSQTVEERSRPMVQLFATILFEILLSFLGMMVVAHFSRRREFRADAGGARYAGREKMIAALEGLQRLYHPPVQEDLAYASLKISGKKSGGLMALLSTHPPIEVRIARLKSMAI